MKEDIALATGLTLHFIVVPNPQNGCLCEVVQICTCVARHLQNTQTTMNRNPVALLASDTASPLSLPSTSPAMGEDDPAQHLPELPATGDTISAITATTNSTTRSTLGTGNMDQHNFLQSTFPSAGMIHAPPYEVRVGDTINQKYALSFNTQLDAPPQRNIFHPAFDNVQMDPTLTSLSTATKTTNRSDGTIDILDLFLHQDINDLLSL